jgi:glycosyltransferase involved in cell wall biosynthesis
MPSRPGIIALVAETWSWRWSTRHQILTRLAERFPTVWVDPAHEWRDARRRLRVGGTTVVPLPNVPEFIVYRPEAWLPKLYGPKRLANATLRGRMRRARTILRTQGCDQIILSLWHPKFADAIKLGFHDLSVYHIDDEYSFSEHASGIDPVERKLLADVDQVFVHSTALLESKGPFTRHIELTPNGVDYYAFAAPTPEPIDLARIPRPRIGYTGFIKKQLDWKLMLELARAHPEWSFVFVGKRSPHPEINGLLAQLDTLPNVYFLGAKSTSVLAHYPQHFDVCVMPYQVNNYTKYINPLKLNEYLAAGRPCVGPPIPSLIDAPEVTIAQGSEAWTQAILDNLRPVVNTPERIERRQNAAKQFDWNVIVRGLTATLETRLAERQAEA